MIRLTMKADARLAELADAALLKSAPEVGPGSSPGAGTSPTPCVRDGRQLGDSKSAEMPVVVR